MAAETTDALVLRTYPFGETSQIVHLFSESQGRIHGLAKGARRLNGSFHGGFDLLTLGDLSVYSRRPGAELRTLGAFRTFEVFGGLRGSLPRFHAACHVAGLLLGFTREEQPLPELFSLTVAALRLLAEADDDGAEALLLGYEAMLLAYSGHAPELSRCVVCERPARRIVSARLSPLLGGLLCRRCRGRARDGVELTGEGVACLARLSEGPLVRAPALPARPPLRDSLRTACDAWTTTVLDRPLRTAAYL